MIKVNDQIANQVLINGTNVEKVQVNNVTVFEIIQCTITAEPKGRGYIDFTFQNNGKTRLNIYITEDSSNMSDNQIMSRQTLWVNPDSSEQFSVRDFLTPQDYLFYINNGMNWIVERIVNNDENSSDSSDEDPYYS